MTAVLLAGASGTIAVAAAWDALGALQSPATRRSLSRIAGPLHRAATGREPTKIERRRLALVAGLTLLAAGYLVSGALVAVGLAAAGPFVVAQILRASRERWRSDLARGAPSAARAVADALSGGCSVIAAVEVAARPGAVPGAAGQALRTINNELALGADLEPLLARLAARARDPAWDAIAAAVALQRRAGGDLAGLLRRIAEVADERDRVDADARALTAQARFTARLVAGMPIAGLMLAQAVAPGGSSAVLSNPLSTGLLGLAGIILAASLMAIRRIARPLR